MVQKRPPERGREETEIPHWHQEECLDYLQKCVLCKSKAMLCCYCTMMEYLTALIIVSNRMEHHCIRQ